MRCCQGMGRMIGLTLQISENLAPLHQLKTASINSGLKEATYSSDNVEIKSVTVAIEVCRTDESYLPLQEALILSRSWLSVERPPA